MNEQVIAVLCSQWGDSGKGKVTDYLSATWADVVARGTGGNNAGHTTVVNGKKRIFHLLPAGIMQDFEGKVNILGNGMALDPNVLVGEIQDLERENLSCNHLRISEDAQVVMPYHIAEDKRSNLTRGIVGSTERGIGPCYTDKVARRGIQVRDLYRTDTLAQKIKNAKEVYPSVAINLDEIISNLAPLSQRIRDYVCDTDLEMQNFHKNGKRILLEGAQGFLLSIEHGISPYVTSSDCSLNGTASGVGLSAKAVDLTLNLVKFPYMTRVGGGPFPTELGGKRSEDYCAEKFEGNTVHTLENELLTHSIPHTLENGSFHYDSHHPNILALMNSSDPFKRGIGIRLAGGEYGATTGRPRRIGWTDLVSLQRALAINGPHVILTKPDVFSGAESYSITTTYLLDGREHPFTRDPEKLRKIQINSLRFSGFTQDLSTIKNYQDLPPYLRSSMDYLELATGAKIAMISTGPERDQLIKNINL